MPLSFKFQTCCQCICEPLPSLNALVLLLNLNKIGISIAAVCDQCDLSIKNGCESIQMVQMGSFRRLDAINEAAAWNSPPSQIATDWNIEREKKEWQLVNNGNTHAIWKVRWAHSRWLLYDRTCYIAYALVSLKPTPCVAIPALPLCVCARAAASLHIFKLPPILRVCGYRPCVASVN